jgi:hypothetical protein
MWISLFLQGNRIEPRRYYELFEKDTLKFGNSRYDLDHLKYYIGFLVNMCINVFSASICQYINWKNVIYLDVIIY